MRSDILHVFSEFKHIILGAVFVVFVFSTVTVVGFVNRAAEDVRTQIENNIYEFNEFDRTHLCNITGCTHVDYYVGGKTQHYEPVNKELKEVKSMDDFSFNIRDVRIYPFVYKIGVLLPNHNTLFVVPFPQTLKYVLITIAIIVIILLVTGILYFNYNMRRIRTHDLMSYSSEKTNLQSLITSVLTENLHHEMKTPLASMASELRHIKQQMGISNECSGCSRFDSKTNLLPSFNIIEEDIKSIHNIIETIKTSKMMRYSNGNRSLYDIISSAKDIVTVTSKVKFFEISVDDNFRQFSLNKFRNEDLLNIVINHMKNSIEANSTKIVFDCPNDKNASGYLTFYIVDNGNGIPAKAKDKIYELHFSTKDTPMNDSMRGVGMYLSRQLLRAYGGDQGDEWVYETSKEGTTFGIRVPVKYKVKH